MKNLDGDGSLRGYVARVRGFSHNAKMMVLGSLFKGLSLAMYNLVFNLFLYSLGYRQDFLGLILAAQTTSALLASVPSGLLSDRIGHKPMLVIGAAATPVAMVGMATLTTPTWLILLAVIYGAFTGTYWISGWALMMDASTEDDRVHLFAVNAFLLWGIGALGGALAGGATELAGALLEMDSRSAEPLRWGVLSTALVMLLGAVPFLLLRELPRRRATAGQLHELRASAPLFVRLLVPDLILSFGIGLMLFFIPLFFVVKFGVAPGTLGLFLSFAGITAGGLTLVAPLLSARWGYARGTVYLLWAQVPALASLALVPQVWMAMPIEYLRASLRSLSDPLYSAFRMSQASERQRGTLSSLYSFTWNIGITIGAPVSGYLQVRTGFTWAFVACALCYLVAASALYFLFVHHRQPGQARDVGD